jgi:putative hydrolase of the HAD superfamily
LLRASSEEHGREFQALCETFGLRTAIVPELLQVFRTHRPELWLTHGAIDTLQALRNDGWRLAILTNGLPPVQAAKIHALGLAQHVDHIVYAAEYADKGKPNRAVFAEVLRRLNLVPSQCVMVGDDADCDIRGGREAGMRTIWMRRNSDETNCGADVAVASLADVPAAAASLVELTRAHAA